MKSLLLCSLVATASIAGQGAGAAEPFTNFESGPVRPLALSQDRNVLYALNTPDNRLEIFRVTGAGLTRAGSTVVGLEPVAVAVRSASQVFVVNHLSDSVSVVDASDPDQPVVRETLLVGDEPRDAVLAGPDRSRLFVTTAHRGQNNPRDPQLTTPGVGRADVWIFDVAALPGELAVVTLFCDTPRALAASPDGSKVFAAAFHSGNQTTVLNQIAVSDDPTANGLSNDGFLAPGMPPPLANTSGEPAPEVGTILRRDPASGKWLDEIGRDWSARVRFNLPDKDVFTLDANATPPTQIAAASGVGTVIFNLAVHPGSGAVYATNIESRNHVRFEPVLSGHIVENRVTVVAGASVTPVHLNAHIDYSSPAGPAEEIDQSLSTPLDLVFTADGSTLYVAAFGSAAVGVLDASAHVTARIPVGGGPAGLALDEGRARLYVLCRFDQTIHIVDTAAKASTGSVPVGFDAEPADVRQGRPVLYSARNSGHGDASCASCHIFGDFDSLAWDLGDPNGKVEANPIPRVAIQGGSALTPFHPMKGPMTTQSLRGMAGAGAMHWRGDRNAVSSGAPDPDVFDEGEAFLHFRGAFQGLLGKATELPLGEMQAFKDFILTVRYPPNPLAPIDGTLTAQQTAGKAVFDSNGSRAGVGGDGNRCADCHTLPFGTDGHGSFELEVQDFKVAHLRNLYQKVGMFGTPLPRIVREPAVLQSTPTPHEGDQIRGFGFLHDGSVPTLLDFFRVRFLPIPPFTFPDQPGRTGTQKVRDLESFVLTFPTGLAPVVGHQVTLEAGTAAARRPRLDTFVARALAGDCDLVAHGRLGGKIDGLSFVAASDRFQSSRADTVLTLNQALAALGAGDVLTFTAVPPGSGQRIGIDRDGDTHLDGDEVAAGSDPANPASVPGGNVSFLRGSCNDSPGVDISDPVALLFHLFAGGPQPPCRAACDASTDNALDVSDAIFTLNYLFLGGPAPGSSPECETAPPASCATASCP